MCIHIPPPPHEPNDTKGLERDVILYMREWSRFVLAGLSVDQARLILRAETERMRALCRAREEGA